ncbi:hypothetical protein GGR56DRAFT_608117 [Xylariaceae sp. FL0804]|nr:hypothetical protein GGR56DRAFT_608117 [Xylariaceae sp. FL0804]
MRMRIALALALALAGSGLATRAVSLCLVGMGMGIFNRTHGWMGVTRQPHTQRRSAKRAKLTSPLTPSCRGGGCTVAFDSAFPTAVTYGAMVVGCCRACPDRCLRSLLVPFLQSNPVSARVLLLLLLSPPLSLPPGPGAPAGTAHHTPLAPSFGWRSIYSC